jgi:hypothetical protein
MSRVGAIHPQHIYLAPPVYLPSAVSLNWLPFLLGSLIALPHCSDQFPREPEISKKLCCEKLSMLAYSG